MKKLIEKTDYALIEKAILLGILVGAFSAIVYYVFVA
jgi:hypothetical protein